VSKQTTYYIVLSFNKLKHLFEVTKGVIQHIKRLMEAVIELTAFHNFLHEKILTNCLHNKIQKQYISRLDYEFGFLSPLTVLLKKIFSSLLL
jgi:hypothetical protein